MDLRHKQLQKQLVALGYNYTIQPESVLLVEKLLQDLIETTQNLRKYMSIAQEAIEERDTLKFGAEPYKCDNAKLTQQCNELHLKLLEVDENHVKEIKHLRKTICKLEQEKEEFIVSNKKQRERIRELEITTIKKGVRQSNILHSQSGKSKSTSNICSSPTKKKCELDSAMALTEQKVANLTKEVNRFKKQQMDLCSVNDELKQKLNHREKEIQRLNKMLYGGRPLDTLTKECCYKDIQNQLTIKEEEINILQKSNCDLQAKLTDARNKQHDAMKRALQLAERNSQLERELRDIDQIALTVEKECNNSMKTNDEKVRKLQDKFTTVCNEIQSLEKELHAIKMEREQLKANLDGANIEKRHLQSALELAMQDKKTLSERLNKCTIIEQDLNVEIDKLVQQTAEQTRIIADLKGQLLALQLSEAKQISSGDELPRQHQPRREAPPFKQQSNGQKENQRPGRPENASKMKLTGPVTGNDNRNRSDPRGSQRISSDRDYYSRDQRYATYEIPQKLDISVSSINENINKINNFESNNGTAASLSRHSNINVLHEQIAQLQYENQMLAKEKHSLLARLENVRDYTDATEYLTMKASLKRLERERDLLKSDVDRLEEERNSGKNRLKVSSELHGAEIERYRKLVNENEEQIRKLERERYDVLQNQGSRQATITNLEDQCDTLKEQLKSTQDELVHQKTIYSQLKILHEQTDRALADSQSQLLQLEKQLALYDQKHNIYDNKTQTLNNDISRLKTNIDTLTKNLMDVEREKDALLMQLDEKTEKIVHLESVLQSKDNEIEQLREQANDLRQKFGSTLDERNTTESQLKFRNNELLQLRRDLEAALKTKENIIQENKRIQEELSQCMLDNRAVRTELEVSKRQVTDLKMQLQHYCAEVKRIEDMMAHKEVERSEMLDQFRSLTNEASALENTNSHLETAASQSRVQLSVALDHAGELEQIIEQQKALISGYEKQISDLTSQVASLEMQMQFSQMQGDKTIMELSTLRDLCSKLDKQKDDLQRQLKTKEFIASKAQEEVETTRRSHEIANLTLQKEQSSTRDLENLLGDTRHQLTEQRLVNEDLRLEVSRLTNQVSDMEQNLTLANERLDAFQEKAVEYSKQNKQLRREIVNERYYQTNSETKRYPHKVKNLAQNLLRKVSEAPSKLLSSIEYRSTTAVPSDTSDETPPPESYRSSRVSEYDTSATSSGLKCKCRKLHNTKTATMKYRCVKMTSGSQTNRDDYKSVTACIVSIKK